MIMAKKKPQAEFKDNTEQERSGVPVEAENVSKASSAASETEGRPVFKPLGQYVKDMSFECPKPPMLLPQEDRQMDLKVGVNAATLNADKGLYEVVVALRAQGVDGAGGALFLSELAYAGVFEAQGLSQGQLDALLHVDGASLVFPFARQKFIEMLSESGFKAPVLEPINFAAIYQNAQKKA